MNRFLKILPPVGVLLLGGLVLALMLHHRRQAVPTPPVPQRPLVRVSGLSPTNHQFHVRTQGIVSPRTEIELVAEVAGRIIKIAPTFNPGGFFAEGDELVLIDPRDYELAVTQAEATLAQAQTALDREEAEAAVARAEWKRLGTGEPSPLLLRKPQLAQARAAVASARARLQIAKRDLERCRVKAPFAGRVRTKQADVGQFVNRGSRLARIYAVDYVEIRLPLPLDDLAYVDLPVDYRGETAAHPGPKARLSARIGGRLFTWEGRIVRTEGEVDPRTRMVTAVARVDDPYARSAEWDKPPLAVGLFVEADILGKTVTDVYRAPRAAFHNDRTLRVVDRDDRLRFRAVKILRREADEVVFRDGVQPGDRICVSPLEVATDGMHVRVLNETPRPPAPAAKAAPKEDA